MSVRGLARWAPVAAAALATVGLGASPAAGAEGPEYAGYTLDGAPPASTGTVDVAATGGPQATFTTNSTRPRISAGTSAFLNASTPFGAAFGSSQGKPYLNLATAEGRTPSTTTFTFDQPPTAGSWGLALGDIDADDVRITATGADGEPLTAEELGFQGTFNYCASSPRPSGCTGGGPFVDEPAWDAASATLRGSGRDTYGASAWLRPTAEVRTLTLTFSVRTGIPSYQAWFATETSDISGTVTDGDGAAPPEGTVVELQRPDGTPVVDDENEPVTTTPGTDGSYAFEDVAAGDYTVGVEPAEGATVEGADSRPVQAGDGDVTGVDFTVQPAKDCDCEPKKPQPKGYGG
ncbi:carboxypeptidase-like regulatory domain-containing protein [Streptomyces sp. Da 82-17]|uniref:carboxypeptidase-like regulatory domain-containing protein n=1 Tax=Streptomyces sp. Da 82-17 TaxID=3377116 RepID=UPI0038D39976